MPKGLFILNASVTITLTLTGATPVIFLMGTVTGRMGCIPILTINHQYKICYGDGDGVAWCERALTPM